MLALTSKAADHITSQLQTRGQGIGVRVGVRPSGCSGLAYVLEFVDQPEQDDILVQDHDVKVFVSPASMEYLKGTELDFVREGLNQGLVFRNPNVKAECGCGESFTV